MDSMSLKLMAIWLDQEVIDWLRGTGLYADIPNRATDLIKEAWRRHGKGPERFCACGCHRRVSGRQKTATPSCRKRLQRHRLSQLTVTN